MDQDKRVTRRKLNLRPGDVIEFQGLRIICQGGASAKMPVIVLAEAKDRYSFRKAKVLG